MDCETTKERLVAWLEGELAPGEAELLEHHLSHCDSCAAHSEVLAAQQAELHEHFRPRLVPGLAEHDIWRRMDHALAEEMDRAAAAESGPPPLLSRRIQLPAWGAGLYAAALMVALAWGWSNWYDARTAEIRADEVIDTLEREARLGPIPGGRSHQEDQFNTASYTPHRGTF